MDHDEAASRRLQAETDTGTAVRSAALDQKMICFLMPELKILSLLPAAEIRQKWGL